MGELHYGTASVRFDDRLLTHLQVVVIQRFRRGEGFVMSWLKPLSAGSGRSSVWLAPGLQVSFDFDGSRLPTMNQEWLARLTESAGSARGLIVTNEDGSLARSADPPRPAEPQRRHVLA